MREKMKQVLMDAYRNPAEKRCFYSFNLERTGSKKLDARPFFDWTPEPSRNVPDNTTCIFPLGLGCPETRTSDGKIWADPLFDDDEEEFKLDLPDVRSGYTGKILNNIKEMAANLPVGEKIREPDIQSPLGIAELVCGQGLYIALLEYPEEIKVMLEKIADFEIAFIRAMREAAGDKLNGACFPYIWNDSEGTLCSDDTLTLISPAMHLEFSIPYVNQIADAVGPLFYHSCTWLPEHFDNIKQVRNVRAYNWNLGNSLDPHIIMKEFSGRAVIAPHICKGMHLTADVKKWGSFADEVELLRYVLDGMQENTTCYFWLGEFEKDPALIEKLYSVLDERGYTPAAQGFY
jgi:hypothetical protein